MIKATVRNRLGLLGNYNLSVKENGSQSGDITIFPGETIEVPQASQNTNLERIEIMVKDLNSTNGIPISIDSPDHIDVNIDTMKRGKKWEISFQGNSTIPLDNITTKANVKAMDDEDENVNVTVGQDEPPLRSTAYSMISLITVSLAVGLGIGPFINESNPLLWGGLIGVSVLTSLITGYLARKGKNSDSSLVLKDGK